MGPILMRSADTSHELEDDAYFSNISVLSGIKQYVVS
jgi:hypothetical protein